MELDDQWKAQETQSSGSNQQTDDDYLAQKGSTANSRSCRSGGRQPSLPQYY